MQSVLTLILLLLLGLAVLLFLWFFPSWQVYHTKGLDKEKAETCLGLINDSRQTWAQVLAGVFFLVTAYFTWRTVMAGDESVKIANENVEIANKSVDIANKSLDVARNGQITDRFTKAVDQLGAAEDNRLANLPKRIGAIYALEQIAHDSPQYHWPVMEVLTAYLRLNAKWKGIRQDGVSYPEDFQSILTVLGRRVQDAAHTEPDHLDMNNCDLAGADLRGVHLENAYLYGAHLEGAYMVDSHLENANLTNAHFAVLDKKHPARQATMTGCTLIGCDLTNADLRDTDLTQCSITQKQLDSAYTNAGTKVVPSLHVTPRSPP